MSLANPIDGASPNFNGNYYGKFHCIKCRECDCNKMLLHCDVSA